MYSTATLQRLRTKLLATLWNGIAGALPRVAMLLAGLYVAHRFGADAYARYALAFATFALVGTLPGMTLTTVVSKFVPEFAAGDGSGPGGGAAVVVRFSLALAAALAGGVLILAPLLSQLFALEPPISGLLRAAAVSAALTIVACGAIGLLVGAARFGIAAGAYLFGFVLFAAAVVPLAEALGPAGVLFALGLLFAGAGAVALLASRAPVMGNANLNRVPGRFRELWRFFVPMVLAAGLVTPVMWLVNALLSRSAASLAELARFNAAFSWFAALSFVPAVLAQVEFVELAQARARQDHQALARKLWRFVMQNAIVMLPLALAAAAFAPMLVGLYRLEGESAERTLLLMVGAAFVASLGNPAGLFLSASNRTWIASGLNLLWGVVTLALCWRFRDQGAPGAALAFLMGYLVHFVLAIAVAHRLLSGPQR